MCHPACGGLIVTLLLALNAHAIDHEATARRAWAELQVGRAEQAFELTQSMHRAHPSVAAVHVAAAQRHLHPLQVAIICRDLIALGLRQWPSYDEPLRTCGWHMVATRTHRTLADQAARHLVGADPFDDDARGLLLAVRDMDELPRRKWDPPNPPGTVKARRKRDFVYLWRYLRPEDGSVTVHGEAWVVPTDASTSGQAREGVHSTLFLRPHEVVLGGWRGAQQFGGMSGAGFVAPPSTSRPSTHQLHGAYRVALWSRTALQLDATVIFGEGRDEGAIRFRAERTGLGLWSADPAVVWTPWGTHAALRLGWEVAFEGLATTDLRIEGQAGDGGPRALVLLGVWRNFGSTLVRLDGQLGRAARPLGDRYVIRDLPGLEGAGGSLSVQGRVSGRFHAKGEVGVRQLHRDFGATGVTAGMVGLEVTGGW